MEEDLIQIQSNIKKYYISTLRIKVPEKYIGVQLKKIGGLSNVNYSAIIKDMTTNEKILQVLYRKFGVLSESVNHELETTIINYLSKKGYGPKLLYESIGDYRISEYLIGTTTIPKEKSLDSKIIDKLCVILSIFTGISYTYKFYIQKNNIFLNQVDDGINEKRIDISKNQFDNCMHDWIDKAKIGFKKFTDKFYQKYSKELNPKECADVEFIQKYLDNFEFHFLKNFPLKGFLVLCHNDTHRLNVLIRKKDQKMFLIDQEYSFLNLPGNDMANYLNENFFNYEPEYYCNLEKLDFDKTYAYYEKFIDMFIQGHKFLDKEEGGKEFLKLIRSKKYFIQVTNIINLYWFIWSFCYTDFDTWEKDHYGEYYFVHGIDRLNFYLAGMKAIEKLKK